MSRPLFQRYRVPLKIRAFFAAIRALQKNFFRQARAGERFILVLVIWRGCRYR
jgi:hypothetical protein